MVKLFILLNFMGAQDICKENKKKKNEDSMRGFSLGEG